MHSDAIIYLLPGKPKPYSGYTAEVLGLSYFIGQDEESQSTYDHPRQIKRRKVNINKTLPQQPPGMRKRKELDY